MKNWSLAPADRTNCIPGKIRQLAKASIVTLRTLDIVAHVAAIADLIVLKNILEEKQN